MGGRERREVITNIGTIVVKAVIEARCMCIHHVHVSMGDGERMEGQRVREKGGEGKVEKEINILNALLELVILYLN